MMNQNPYSKAAETYGKTSAALPTDQRGLEGTLLLKAATKLQQLQELMRSNQARREDISDIIDYNRKLWTIFATNAADDDHGLPLALRNNIANLGIFVFKRSTAIISDPQPEKLDALIEINRNIAAGLLTQPKRTGE